MAAVVGAIASQKAAKSSKPPSVLRRSKSREKNMRQPFPDAKDWERDCVLELLMLDG